MRKRCSSFTGERSYNPSMGLSAGASICICWNFDGGSGRCILRSGVQVIDLPKQSAEIVISFLNLRKC